jgi:HAD superfamily phosphoserine phosphatase-like hydrolase
MSRQFAVFDIDGTIVRTSLLQLIIKELVNRGVVDGAIAGDVERLIHDARQRVADEDFGAYMKQAVDLIIQHAGGKLKLADYTAAVNAVSLSLNASTYVYTRQLIETLRNNNFFLIAISGSEQRVVEAVSRQLGFHTCAAGVMYVDDGTYITGETKRFEIRKAEVLRGIIARHELQARGSIAIGDTSRDIDAFELVSQPIAFNPNQALFKMARERGWMVVLERKDVVYGLQLENDRYVLKSVNV